MKENNKLFEIRDRATFLVVMGTILIPECEEERYLLARSGFGITPEEQSKYIIITRMSSDCKTYYNPFDWEDRTLSQAHIYIASHWDELATGQVIDIEYILGETSQPKESERLRYV